MRKRLVCILFIVSLFGCKSDDEVILNTGYVTYTKISMDCFNNLFAYNYPGILKVVTNSQNSYDSLIYTRFQKPLDDLREVWYPEILDSVKSQFPGLADSQYVVLAEERLYDLAPFIWIKGCTNPSIDFQRFTLLGFSVSTSGCKSHDNSVTVYRDDIKHELIFKLQIKPVGICDLSVTVYKWILIPKLPDYYSVIFQSEVIRE